MKTIHLIFNAHLDPIWLWPWHAGLAEVLSTARSVCDQLDECDDLIFTRGESWFYEQVQKLDPVLFDRIKQHIANGRWEIVGGWYIQPDCNLPSDFGLAKQIKLGKAYFQREFGQFPDTAYNVDTFGHAATLPKIIADGGQSNYIMMRPQEHEMDLPARLFRWQGQDNGPIITTFRIARAYCTPHQLTEDHIRASLSQIPDGINHTMSFVGLGDHGGGPSRAMTQWCRELADRIDDVKIVFSSPSRFFAAISDDIEKLPLVKGELQMHAVGCYTVDRKTKVLVRQSEHGLRACETIVPEPASTLDQSWRYTCFHHFHDTLGGTCIPSAYPVVHAQLGHAIAQSDQILRSYTLMQSLEQSPDTRQRIVLYNPAPLPFDGFVQVEPWLEWNRWKPSWQLETQDGMRINHQVLPSEALVENVIRIGFHCHIAPQSCFTAYINQDAKPIISPNIYAKVRTDSDVHMANEMGCELKLCMKPIFKLAGQSLSLPRLVLQHDSSDTWSHRIDRYEEPVAALPVMEHCVMINRGPLMASIMEYGKIGSSPYETHWQLHADEPTITLDLHIEWIERQRILKLVWDMPTACMYRMDGIPGGVLKRESDGRERPLRDLTQLHLADDSVLGISCPDVFALDGCADQVRLTLLRSALMAHHIPHNGQAASRRFSDRGEHDFHFVFTAGESASIKSLEQLASQHWNKPLMTDQTKGMPSRMMRE